MYHNFSRWILRSQTASLFELHFNIEEACETGGIAIHNKYRFREAIIDDLPACAALTGFPVEEYRRRTRQGNRCYVVFYGDEPINLNWIHTGPYYVRGLGFMGEYNKGRGYLYNLFTHPNYRGEGLYKYALKKIINILAGQNITCFQQIVENDNPIPLAVLPTLGYKMTQTIMHTRICGLKITVVRDPSGKILSHKIFIFPPKNIFKI
jgi:GNAT superfamily N-acetyltransferase